MRRDITRTIVVVAELPHLWAAVQERIDPALGLVRHARPAQLCEVWRRADPWPWVVVGAADPAPAALAGLVSGKPIPVWWLGESAGLPHWSVVFQGWTQLAVRLDGLQDPVLGLRFAARRGVRDQSRHYTRDTAELEGLMAAHPWGLPRFDTLRRLRSVIAKYDLPCQVRRGEASVTLEPHDRRRGQWR